jgi:hypothetical protein
MKSEIINSHAEIASNYFSAKTLAKMTEAGLFVQGTVTGSADILFLVNDGESTKRLDANQIHDLLDK